MKCESIQNSSVHFTPRTTVTIASDDTSTSATSSFRRISGVCISRLDRSIDRCCSCSRWEIEIDWNPTKTVLLTYRSLDDSEYRFHLHHAIVYSSLLIIRLFTLLIQLSDRRALEIPPAWPSHPASIAIIFLFRLFTGSASIQVSNSPPLDPSMQRRSLGLVVCWSVRHAIIRHTIAYRDEGRFGNANSSPMTIANVSLFVVTVGRYGIWSASFTCARRSFPGEANVRVGTSFDNKTDQGLGASLAANDGNIIVSVEHAGKRSTSSVVLRLEHRFWSIASTMDWLWNMKYQVAPWSGNTAHRYRWSKTRKSFLRRFSIGVGFFLRSSSLNRSI